MDHLDTTEHVRRDTPGRCVGGCLLVVTFALAAAGCGDAAVSNDEASVVDEVRAAPVFPPESRPYGRRYADWGDRWWQWVFSLPATAHPLFDTTGADCARGQAGPVWFLGGSFVGGGPITRTCTIPVGRSLLFPIVNAWSDNVGVVPPVSVAQLREWAAGFTYPATELSVTIDGAEVRDPSRFRFLSRDPFRYVLPATDNLLQGWGYDVSGPVYPAVSDGYWIMVPPMWPGRHVIRFHGTVPAQGFTLDITYNLTVSLHAP